MLSIFALLVHISYTNIIETEHKRKGKIQLASFLGRSVRSIYSIPHRSLPTETTIWDWGSGVNFQLIVQDETGLFE